MENVDYIVVGDGYAALFFAHQLIKHNKKFLLFSEGKKSASQVSAGIINPAVLKKFTTFWKAQEQIDFLKKTISEIEIYTGKNYLINEPINRIFHDENEKQLWLKKSEKDELRDFLSKEIKHLEKIKNPFGVGEVMQSARLDVENFFKDILNFLDLKGHLIKEKFNYQRINPEQHLYKNFIYKHIIFCEGMNVKENPYFSTVEVHQNKGHHLKVELTKPLVNKSTIKKKHFLFPIGNNLHYYGGTYDREQNHNNIDESAKEQLINGLSEFYEDNFEIKEINFGFRPTVKDRRPILGNHNFYKNLYVFNGLGARGILNGCFFANELYENIENRKPIHPEVDLMRFQKKNSSEF